MEGEEARLQRAGDLARQDVPTCRLDERVGEVQERVQKAGWDTCVVLNGRGIVLGLLRAEMLTAGSHETVEQVMENGPRTYRLDAPLEKTQEYMQKKGVDSVLVTDNNGKLHGLLKRADVEQVQSR